MVDSTVLKANQMRKYLVLHNKEVRADLIVKGLAKMNKAQLKTEFDKRFTYTGGTFKPKEHEDFRPVIKLDDLKAIFTQKGKKVPDKIKPVKLKPNQKRAEKKDEPKEEEPKEKPKKKFLVKRKTKGGKVVEASKKEM